MMKHASENIALESIINVENLNIGNDRFTCLVKLSQDGRFLMGTECGNLLLVLRVHLEEEDNKKVEKLKHEGVEEEQFLVEELDFNQKYITAVVHYKEDIVYIATDREVVEYDIKSKQIMRTIYRSTLKIRGLAIRPNNNAGVPIWLAIATDDVLVSLVDVKDINNTRELAGHTRSLRCVSFSPDGKYLASGCAFGSIRLWALSSMSCVKNLYGLFPESESIFNVNIYWSTSFLLVPGSMNCCFLIDKNTWKYKKITQHSKNNSEVVVHVCVSPDESLFATSTSGNLLNVFSGSKKELIFGVQLEFQCRGLVWSRECHLFIIGEYQVYQIKHNVFNSSLKTVASVNKIVKDTRMMFTPPSPPITSKKRFLELFGSDDSLYDIDSPPSKRVDVVNIDDNHTGQKKSLRCVKNIDDTFGRSKKRLSRLIDESTKISKHTFKNSDISCFQPGATTIISDFCYLAFNTFARIYRVCSESLATITVDFHDKNYLPIKFEDKSQLFLAAVSKAGTVFACDGELANTNSIVQFKSCPTNPDIEDWFLEIKNGEHVKIVAITDDGPVCATDKNFIRFFSISGLQTFVYTAPYIPITMVGSKDYIFIVSQSESVSFHYTLINAKSKVLISSGPLGIIYGSKPLWVGFDEKQVPLVYDSEGYLHHFHLFSVWVPILQMSKTIDAYEVYPIDVMENKLYYLQKSLLDNYPVCQVFQEAEFSVPSICGFINAEKEKMLLSQSLKLNWEMYRHSDITDEPGVEVLKAKIDKDRIVLELLLESLKSKKTNCVRDLCSLLNTNKALEGAEKMATHYKLYSLLDYITSLKNKSSRELAPLPKKNS